MTPLTLSNLLWDGTANLSSNFPSLDVPLLKHRYLVLGVFLVSRIKLIDLTYFRILSTVGSVFGSVFLYDK